MPLSPEGWWVRWAKGRSGYLLPRKSLCQDMHSCPPGSFSGSWPGTWGQQRDRGWTISKFDEELVKKAPHTEVHVPGTYWTPPQAQGPLALLHPHTGASPGHSYTVKSPSSFSSSDDAESGSLGSSLCLGGRRCREEVKPSGMMRTTPVNDRTRCLLPGCLLLQGEHLLLLVLVVVHLGTLSQRLVPRLWREQEQLWRLGCGGPQTGWWRASTVWESLQQSTEARVPNTSQGGIWAPYRDLVIGQGAGYSLG